MRSQPSSQEAWPSAAYSELVDVLSRATRKACAWLARWAPRVSSFEARRSLPHRRALQAWKEEAAIFSAICIVRSPVPGSSHFPPALLTRQPLTSPTLWVLWSRVTPPCRWLRILLGLTSFTFFGSLLGSPAPLLPSKPCRTHFRPYREVLHRGRSGRYGPSHNGHPSGLPGDVLKEMDEGTGLTPEAVKELRRATDLALRATKHTARAVGRSMAASVAAERHLCSTLTDDFGGMRGRRRF